MTKSPLAGIVRVTCIFGKKGNWKAGYHTGIDLVNSDQIIYASCYGDVVNMGYDASYGNFVVVKAVDGYYHWYCHMSKITCNLNQHVTPENKLGVMGATGNATGVHLHYEIRNKSNRYGDVINPANYIGITNRLGSYNESELPNDFYELRTLARNTNLRSEPSLNSKEKSLYLSGTTLYVLESSAEINDGYIWDKVKIRVNGKIGYMINKNYR